MVNFPSPFNLGRAPSPEVLTVIFLPFDPEPLKVNSASIPLKTLPAFIRILSPGTKLLLATFFKDFHGLSTELPLLSSFPDTESI